MKLTSETTHATIYVTANKDGTYTVDGPNGNAIVSKEAYNSMIRIGKYHTGGKRRRTKRVRKSYRKKSYRRRTNRRR